MNFIRSFDKIEQLRADPLFQTMLIDLQNGAIFPAIRNGYMSFYYKGGGLFEYNSQFKTHYKYAFVPEQSKNDYVTEASLQTLKLVSSFQAGYKRIKENCENYGTIEATGVSALYKYSALSHSNIVLLDTEVALYEEADKNRIDLLLYDNAQQKLLFCEAKHFSNKELWAEANSKPTVVAQIARYNDTISNNTELILKQYTHYIEILNKMFSCTLNPPLAVQKETGLLIFGYDANQSKKISDLLIADGSLEGIKHYKIGDISKIKAETLFNILLQ